jgi:hypothetical protein
MHISAWIESHNTGEISIIAWIESHNTGEITIIAWIASHNTGGNNHQWLFHQYLDSQSMQ